MASTTSSSVSPIPRMRFDFVTRPASRALVMTERERSYRNPGRIRLKMRGTVSTLWARTSGRLEKTSASWSSLESKSGMRSSTPVPAAVLVLERVDLADRLRVQPGAAVVEVVAGDARDRGVAQSHLTDGVRDAARFVRVEVCRLAGVDLAEVTASGALLAADEERGLAVLPALEDVGAAGLFAHGVQSGAAHE